VELIGARLRRIQRVARGPAVKFKDIVLGIGG